MRIACYALIDKNAGSVASANFMILEELLKRGYQIDFYAIKGFNNPQELFIYKNFNYIPLLIEKVLYIWEILEKNPNKQNLLYSTWAKISTLIYFREMAKLAEINHSKQKYDLCLFLGLLGFFKLKNTPTISWVQGPIQTELQSIENLRKDIISLCGIKEYIKLKLFYFYRINQDRNLAKMTDIFICGSEWARSKMIEWGINNQNVKALPYPIDTSYFKPSFEPIAVNKQLETIKFLWLGRIVPRKRLDLVLSALSLLIKENRNVELIIIGSFGYGRGYKKLIDRFDFLDRITYKASISRLDVPELFNSIDFLIQPSENENFGSSVAEALCCGKSVIVGASNGTNEYISDSSVVFSEYSVDSVKKAMETAIASLKNPNTIAQDARLTAEKQFDISVIVNKLEAIFEEASQEVKLRSA